MTAKQNILLQLRTESADTDSTDPETNAPRKSGSAKNGAKHSQMPKPSKEPSQDESIKVSILHEQKGTDGQARITGKVVAEHSMLGRPERQESNLQCPICNEVINPA